MIRLTRSQVQPVGLDIGSDSVKMLQVELSGRTLSVVSASRQPIPPSARESPELRLAVAGDLIKQLFRHGKFSGRRAVVAVPREMLHVKNLRMPLIPPQELISAVRFEARNIFPFDTDSAHIQIIPAGEVRQGIDVRQEVIVLAARHEDVGQFIEQMHRCGVIVESLDVEACALYRSQERFIRRKEDEQEVQVLVDIGQRRSQVVIGRGRDISFIKPIEIGSFNLHEAISRKLGITIDEARGLRRRLIEGAPGPASPELLKNDPVRQAVFDATRSIMEELGREIALCLRYYSVTFRGHRPSKVRLLGGEAADPLLLGVLNGALGVPTEAGRPLYSLDTSRMDATERMGFMSEWATAFGLSMKLTTGQFAPRDGNPRDPAATLPPTAEVVDLDKALEARDDVARSKDEAKRDSSFSYFLLPPYPRRRKSMREVEFLPDWYPKVRARKRIVTLQAWATLILVCALGFWTLFIQRKVHARQVELASLRTDLRQSETEIERLVELLKLDQALGAQDQIFMKIGTPMQSTRVITLLEQFMPRDMALLDLTLDTEDPVKPTSGLAGRATQNKVPESTASKLRFRLHGVAPTDVDLAEFLAKLTARPFFKQVELLYSHERQESDHVLREFEVGFVLDLSGMGAALNMKALRIQAEWCAKAQWVLGLVLVLMVGGFFAVIYRPHSQQLRALKQQIDEKRTQLSSNRTRVQILPDVMLAVNEKQARLEKFDKKLPKLPELSAFINDITVVSHQASLRQMEVKPGVPTRTDLYSEYPISFKFEGDFKSVFAFLRQTEVMQRLTRVKGLKLRSPDSGKTGQVQVELSMNIYYSEG